MKIKPVLVLYIISSIAFLFALLKYFYVKTSITINFLILEVISFIGFIGIVYLSYKVIRQNRKQVEAKDKEFQKKEEEYIQTIEQFKTTLKSLQSGNSLEKSEDEIERISIEIGELAAKITELEEFATKLLSRLAQYYEIGLGVCYFKTKPSDKFSVQGVYGLSNDEVLSEINELTGVSGECISSQKVLVVNEIDEDYFDIESCTGLAKPKNIYLLPIVIKNETIGLIEVATFKMIDIENHWEKISKGISQLKVL